MQQGRQFVFCKGQGRMNKGSEKTSYEHAKRSAKAKQALSIARKRGVKLGRPHMEFDEAVAQIYDDTSHGRISVAEASRQYEIPRSTLRYRLKTYEEREIHTPDFESEIEKDDAARIVIYGAQAVAFSTYRALSKKGNNVLFFVVTESKGNPSLLENIPVITLDEFLRWCRENHEFPKVYIATPDSVQQEISDTLEAHDYFNFTCVDSKAFGDLMSDYYSSMNIFAGLDTESYIKDHVAIYQARSEKDRLLKHIYKNHIWTHSVQGGVTQCVRTLSTEFFDNTGDNISTKNSNYSELSVLYWAWKNSNKSVIGLEHYRRFLRVTEADLFMLIDGEVDAVLPFPMIYTPDISEQRRRWISNSDWAATLQALKELAPEYFSCVGEIDSQPYYLNYNMIIARKEVLNEYCAFLFPVLERVEELTDGEKRKDRYIGYIGEYLCTVYFLMMEKEGKMKVRHAAAEMRV